MDADPGRVPPGQYVTEDFPVLSAGPTPHTPLDEWTFSITSGGGRRAGPGTSFVRFPTRRRRSTSTASPAGPKLDTTWEGVSVDTLLRRAGRRRSIHSRLLRRRLHDQSPLEDVTDGQAWIAFAYDGEPLDPEHGGPARLLVPHLYFWKSAKWVRGLELRDDDEPGFWETYGYHSYGDPWREQRYAGD